MLLAEKLRSSEEKKVVQNILQSVCGVLLTPSLMYSLADTDPATGAGAMDEEEEEGEGGGEEGRGGLIVGEGGMKEEGENII